MAREVTSTTICAVRRPATLPLRTSIKQSGILKDSGNPSSFGLRQSESLSDSIPQNTFELVIAGATFSHEALPRGGSNSLTFEAINELLDDIVEPRIADDDQLEAISRRASSLDPLG
jgi:hypothetical protein